MLFRSECVFVRLDVTNEASWQEAVATAVQRFGKLDILVNNAGVLSRGTLEDTTVEEWDRVMDINAKGVFLGTKTAIPEMRNAGGGSIVNTASDAGLMGTPMLSAYCATKRGLVMFTTATAVAWAAMAVRIHCVCPRVCRTPTLDPRLALARAAGATPPPQPPPRPPPRREWGEEPPPPISPPTPLGRGAGGRAVALHQIATMPAGLVFSRRTSSLLSAWT